MNKKFLILGLLFLLVLVGLYFVFGRGQANMNSLADSNPPAKNEESVEKRINWTQKEFSVSPFTTREDPENQTVEDKQAVHIVFTSFFNFSATEKVKSVTVTRVNFTQKVGTQVFIHPPHKQIAPSRSYTFEPDMARLWAKNIVDGGQVYTLNVSNEVPTYYDQVLNQGGMLNFAFITKNIGTLSEQAIMTKDKIYSSGKVLEYLGTKADDLNGKIVIDVNITFEDGKKYAKRFSGTIEGSKILSEPLYIIRTEAL